MQEWVVPRGLDRVPKVCFKEITWFKEPLGAAHHAHMAVVKIATNERLFARLEIPGDAHRDGIADGHINMVPAGFHDVKREGAVECKVHLFYFVCFADRAKQRPVSRSYFLDERQEFLERSPEGRRDNGGQPQMRQIGLQQEDILDFVKKRGARMRVSCVGTFIVSL